MKTYVFTPLDTLFFRDGRPFNQGESNLFGVPSLFPPAAPSLIGALRAALARGQGWTGGPWEQRHIDVLGDGQDLGNLKFTGPYLLAKKGILFPAPAHILGQPIKSKGGGWQKVTRLRPGPRHQCDLGLEVRLPIATEAAEGLKGLDGHWLTREGMALVLAGAVPKADQIVPAANLWTQEVRTGVGLDLATRSVKNGELYTCNHVRLIDSEIKLVLGVSGLPKDWEPEGITPLGGENRMAWIDALAAEVQFPACPDLMVSSDKLRFTATLVTPADLQNRPIPGEPLAGLPGKLVCACQQRPQPIGGWSSENRAPLPLRPLLPAGTTWIMEAGPDEIETVRRMHGTHIGLRTEYGFGQIIIGTWT